MTFDISKCPIGPDGFRQAQTRDGRRVRIYATDGGCGDAIHGAILNAMQWVAHQWLCGGNLHIDAESDYDLINLPS